MAESEMTTVAVRKHIAEKIKELAAKHKRSIPKEVEYIVEKYCSLVDSLQPANSELE